MQEPKGVDYVLAGQLYQRLIFESRQFDIKPAMQVLENFEAMKSINEQFAKEYGVNGEVIMILGVKDAVLSKSNPRHLVEDIIIK